mmetsp:Transcript_12839/g.19289  ORF Transcript_12839/g.19289 Transcript_12839/m.19289 type:complete len:151 (-) Transcript_12839:1628-2080(-)
MWLLNEYKRCITLLRMNNQQLNVSAISSTLEKTLDLDQQKFSSSTTLDHQNPSASKLLLQERNNVQQITTSNQFEMTSFVPRPKSVKVNPLLQQISQSTVEKPKYWKDSSKKGVVKSKSANKTGRKNKQKGEEYKDKFQKKISSSKKKRV